MGSDLTIQNRSALASPMRVIAFANPIHIVFGNVGALCLGNKTDGESSGLSHAELTISSNYQTSDKILQFNGRLQRYVADSNCKVSSL